MFVSRISGLCVAAAFLLSAPVASALTINLLSEGGLSVAALGAFYRAAAQWEARITDPITVTIDASQVDLGEGNILGQASSSLLIGGYNQIRSAMVADSSGETDDAIVAFLPTLATFNAGLPEGLTFGGGIVGTKANLKALGFTNLDTNFGLLDGVIEFNTNFDFDFDNSNGVDSTDFETVAAHEIGHILGFISIVDIFVDPFIGEIITDPGGISPTTLDLFRFAANNNPLNADDFATFKRELGSGVEANFSDTENVYAMSTGALTGDGRQASHFKDDSLTGLHLGIMDPTLGPGVAFLVGDADFRTLDLIGYDIVAAPVPIPPPILLLLSGVALLGTRRRTHASR